MTSTSIELIKITVALLGITVTGGTLIFAIVQYTKNEKWKQKEFLANEIKDFESNKLVKNALTMIDWGSRRINLDLVETSEPNRKKRVTREMQSLALLPHEIKSKYPSKNPPEADNDEIAYRFSDDEASIRDCYDAFLFYLERFGNYVETGLVPVANFYPYLSYWIDSIAPAKEVKKNYEDDKWRLVLYTYMKYYKYEGVIKLFAAFDRNIKPNSCRYRKLKQSIGVKEEEFVIDLENCL